MLSKGEKRGRPGREKKKQEGQKDKSRDCCVTFTVLAQNYFKILLSVDANFMPHNFRKSYFAPGTEGHKVINLQRTVGSLGFFIARQSPENGWDSFKGASVYKIPRRQKGYTQKLTFGCVITF